jgi:adenosylcobinamide-GDP ribazoletransferase
MRQIRLFFTAVQFFTRLPIPRWVGFEENWLNHAARYLPLVGLCVGAIAAAVYAGAAWLFPAPLAVLLSTAAGVYVTGAFHEDGFADVCDGFGGGMTAARTLDIMKDSRIGAYGAIGISLLLALKIVTLSQLPPAGAIAALLAAHPLSRLMAVALIWRLDYARDEGKAKPLAQKISNAAFAVATLTAALPLLAAGALGYLEWAALGAGLLASGCAAAWLARTCVRRIGGYTGDCLGAVQQLSEAMFYLGVVASLGHGAWH